MDKVKGMITINIVLTVIMVIGLLFIGFLTLKGSGNNAGEVFDSGTVSLTEQEITPVKLPSAILANVYELDNSKKQHTLRMDVMMILSSKHDDFKDISAFLGDETKTKMLSSDIQDLVRKKSYEEIKRPDSKQVIESEILELLRNKFNSDAIVDVDLPEYFHD